MRDLFPGDANDSLNPPPACVACGYNLTGLSEPGRCPECGLTYERAADLRYVPRPMFGFGLLLLPELLMTATFAIEAAVFEGGCACSSLLICPVLAWWISLRVADWRYGIELRSAPDKSGFPTRAQFMKRRSVLYFLLQLVALIVTFILSLFVIRYLPSMGVRPAYRGWS
jgi:hypothetical protein